MTPSSHRPRFRFLAGVGLLTGLVAMAGTVWLRPAPPDAPFAEARRALADARRAEAAAYAPAPLRDAEATWDSAMVAWKAENRRWFALRDYGPAIAVAESATRHARTATQRAADVRDSLHEAVAAARPVLQADLERLRGRFEPLPYSRSLHGALGTAQTYYEAALRALATDSLWAAARALQAARTATDDASAHADALLRTYLANLPDWTKWRDETVAWSARHRAPAFLVDKMNRRVFVFVNGRPAADFPVELGPRWMGDKAHEGDLATPEGRYHVVRKLGAGETTYHRALLINYPNEDDRRRFDAARRSGALPPNARIGGLIELHGEGGRGANWTKGCIALTNRDIEALFRWAEPGTPVTIVGALDEPAWSIPASPSPPDTHRP